MAKTVLITGASRGIGRETARKFALEGANVAVNYCKSADDAAAFCAELRRQGYNVLPVQADVSDRAQVQQMFAVIERQLGSVDILVNNAGISQQKLFTDITDDEWQHMLAVNLNGAFYCCQAVLPGMIRKKAGKIINISSVWGISGASCEVHYTVSKAALIGLTKALAKEMGPSGIQVNCVAPGVIDTDMNRCYDAETMRSLAEETPLGVIGRAVDIAETILFLASEKADFITGQVVSPNGGFLI